MEENLKPTWLDEVFVKQVLKSVEGLEDEQDISVSGWQCNHVVPPGTSNFLSLLYHLSVCYRVEDDNRSISLIIKTPLEEGVVKGFVEKFDGYGKELRMYLEVLPKMYEIANNSETLTARAYACPLHNSLVLEDLRELGYKMADRQKQLDAAHCRLFLVTLAKFHGLTVALCKQYSLLIQNMAKSWLFQENIPEKDKKSDQLYTTCNLQAFLITVESMGFERYAEMIRGKIDSFYSLMVGIFKPSGELRVLNHGDCWIPNVLFKYNDADQVEDVKLVDFQTIRIGSFAQDLIYFWWTSANQEVRENVQEEMFELYRKTLNHTLEDLNMSERVKKEEFDNEIRRFSPYALYVCVTLLPVSMADPDDLLDFNEMTENEIEEKFKNLTEDSLVTKHFRSKNYKAILPDLLRQLERFGAFTS